MGTSTWSGPLRAGPIRSTTGTSLGRDVANTGYVLMSQVAAVTQAASSGQAAGVYKTDIVLPADSQIVGMRLFKTTVWNGVATTLNVGTSSAATELAVAADNDASTTLGFLSIIPGDNLTRTNKWLDIGTADLQIWVKSTNTGTGTGYLVVEYVQARNLL